MPAEEELMGLGSLLIDSKTSRAHYKRYFVKCDEEMFTMFAVYKSTFWSLTNHFKKN